MSISTHFWARFIKMNAALGQNKESPIDVLLTDIALGSNLNGFQISYHLRKSHPQLGIVLLSNHCMPAYLSQLGTFGMHSFAYLLKTTATDFEALERAILTVAEGGVVIDHVILEQGRLDDRLDHLTQRQTEILHLVAQGYSNAALAEALHLSPRTIENHLGKVYDMLKITSDSSVQPRVRAVVTYLSARFPHLLQQLNPMVTGSERNGDAS